MPAPNITNWIRIGLLALPIYGLLTFWGTLTHQPDPNADFEAYARYISTTYYLINHLVGSIGGTILAIFGAVALGLYLSVAEWSVWLASRWCRALRGAP